MEKSWVSERKGITKWSSSLKLLRQNCHRAVQEKTGSQALPHSTSRAPSRSLSFPLCSRVRPPPPLPPPGPEPDAPSSPRAGPLPPRELLARSGPSAAATPPPRRRRPRPELEPGAPSLPASFWPGPTPPSPRSDPSLPLRPADAGRRPSPAKDSFPPPLLPGVHRPARSLFPQQRSKELARRRSIPSPKPQGQGNATRSSSVVGRFLQRQVKSEAETDKFLTSWRDSEQARRQA